MIRRDCPAGRRQDQICAHIAQRSGKHMIVGICICTDKKPESTPWCLADIKPVTLIINIMCNIQFIQLSVFNKNLSLIVNYNSRIVNMITVLFNDPGAQIYIVISAALQSDEQATPPGTESASCLAEG